MSRSRFPRAEHTPSVSAEALALGRWFTRARREGLLAQLSPEAWHALSAVLSFTSRSGERCFTVDQLALSLGRSREEVLAALEQLTRISWGTEPLATLEYDRNGELVGARLASLDLFAQLELPENVVHTPEIDVDAPRDEPPRGGLLAELERVGLHAGQAEWLTRQYPLDRIRRQLDWLPRRHPRNPAALLIRAVEADWEAPREAP